MVVLGETEPREHRRGRQRPGEVPGEVCPAVVDECVDELIDLLAHRRLESDTERRGAERHPQCGTQTRVQRGICGGQVACREEQLIRVVHVVPGPARARKRVPVLGGCHDVIEARQGPDVARLVVIARRCVAQVSIVGYGSSRGISGSQWISGALCARCSTDIRSPRGHAIVRAGMLRTARPSRKS